MQIPENEPLSPGLEKRLKTALDAVVPPSPLLSSARYRMGAAPRVARAWRFVPSVVAIGAAAMAITATAATGSPNPAVWRDLAGTVIRNVSHIPPAGPKTVPSAKPQPRATSTGQGTGSSHATPPSDRDDGPKQSPDPRDRSGPWPSPDPSPPHEHPGPSPTTDDQSGHGGTSSSPSPTDHPDD